MSEHTNTEKDIDNRFTYHAPNEMQAALYDVLRGRIRELAHYFAGVLPESREKSKAITHLDAAMMWANASIARNADLYAGTKHDET